MTDPGRADPRAAALRRAADGAPLSAATVLDGIGGPLGIVEGVLPSLVFLVIWVATRAILPSVLLPLAVVAAFVVWRLVRRQTVTSAVGGAVAAAVSAVLALVTHDAANAFVPGLITNAVYGAVLLVSMLIGRPLIGVLAGLLLGDRGWRADARRRRTAMLLTALWVALFGIRLAVEAPLYFADATAALGVARLALGIPLYAPVLVLTLLGVRAAWRERPPVS